VSVSQPADLFDAAPSLRDCDVCGAADWTECVCDPAFPYRVPKSEEVEAIRDDADALNLIRARAHEEVP